MSVKNMYVRKGDEPFWSWAQEQADGAGIALSVWLANLIRNHKYDLGAKRSTEQTPDQLLADVQSRVAEVRALLAGPVEDAEES